MATFSEALTTLVDTHYAKHLGYNEAFSMREFRMTRDAYALSNTNIKISAEIMGGLNDDALYKNDEASYGTFDNCREYGVTVTIGGWTFAVYEHRNSDDVCVEGCPTAEVQPYGPYNGEDKYDVLFSARWRHEHEAMKALTLAIKAVTADPEISREDLKIAMKGAA